MPVRTLLRHQVCNSPGQIQLKGYGKLQEGQSISTKVDQNDFMEDVAFDQKFERQQNLDINS